MAGPGGDSIRPQCNVIVMSHCRETGYAGGGVDDCRIPLHLINKRFNPSEPINLNPTQDKVDDAARIKGHEFPTDPYGSDFVVMRNLEIPFNFNASLELLGLLLSSAMGHSGVGVYTGLPTDLPSAGSPTVAIAALASGATLQVATFSTTTARDAALGKSVVIGGHAYVVLKARTGATASVRHVGSYNDTPDPGVLTTTAANPGAVNAAVYQTLVPASFRHDLRAGDICVYDQFHSTAWITGHAPATGIGAHPESFIRCEGVIVNDLTVSVSSKSWIDLSGMAYSNGRIDEIPMADLVDKFMLDKFHIPAAESAKNYLIGPNIETVIWPHGANELTPEVLAAEFPSDLGATGAGADKLYSATNPMGFRNLTKKFRGFEFSINNSLDTEDSHGNIAAAGVYLDSLRVGDRTYNLGVTVEGHQGDPYWDAYREDTVHRIDVRIPFGNPDLSSLTAAKNPRRYVIFSFPIVTIDTVGTGFDGIRSTLELGVKPFAQPEPGSTAPTPVKIRIENGDPAYNVALN